MGIQKVYSITKPAGKRINPSNLGYITKEGEIVFQTHDVARTYAKNRVVQALKAPEAFEREVCIYKNRVISESNGDTNSVKSIVPEKYISDVVAIHGHPDYIEKGATTPLSSDDVGIFELEPAIKEMIAFNSRGEFSSMKKNANYPGFHFIEEPLRFFGFDVNNLAFKIQKGFEELGPLGRKAKTSYMEVISKYLSPASKQELQTILKTQHMGNYYKFLDKLPDLITDKQAFVQSIHEMWQKLCTEWKIEYTTNFFNLR